MKLYKFWLVLMAATLSNSLFDNERPSNELFTSRLLKYVARKNVEKSIVFSGFSALSPLAQLALASVGDTQKEILTATGLPNSLSLILNTFSGINNFLQNIKGFELKIANRLYVAKDVELNEDFAAESSHAFNSDIKSIDFSQSVQAAREINKWVYENTGFHIKHLLSPSSLQKTVVALINAIYFKGKWKKPFEPKLTWSESFHLIGSYTNTPTLQVEGMHQSGQFKYGESELLHAQILELEYEGEGASLLIVLPKPDSIVYNVVDRLVRFPDALEQAVKDLRLSQTEVMIPKFKIETTIDLKESLQGMYVNKLFEPQFSELDNLVKDQKVCISAAIQKAFFEVNEEGSEAAAASDYNGFSTAIQSDTSYESFIADRPFFFALKVNNIILFNGIYQG